VPVTIKKKAEVESLIAQLQSNAQQVQALLAEEELPELPGFQAVEGDLAEAAKLADQLGSLQDEVKAAKKVVKTAGELSKKIQELCEAHINGPEGSKTILGEAFTVLIGPRVTELNAEGGVALSHEATAESLMRTIHAHPTLYEALGEAEHAAAEGEAIHI